MPFPLWFARNFLKLNERQRKENKQPKEHKANESPAEKKDGWECKKHLCHETSFENQNI